MSKQLNKGEGKNRFKFRSFREHVESIKLNVGFKSIRQRLQEPDDDESHFILTLQKWHLLNRTRHYTAFARQVKPLCPTISLQLYHKDRILDVLLESIAVKDSMAYHPLLELLTAFVQDLQEELYSDFDRICACLSKLVADGGEALLYEWTFSTISHLFKYLTPLLIQDIIHTFDVFHPLFAEKRSYVRGFMAEAFAFLLRKCRGDSLTTILNYIIDKIRNPDTTPYFQQGVAQLLFETIRSVRHNLHSRASPILEHLYKSTLDSTIPFYEDNMVSLIELLHIQLYEHTSTENLNEPVAILLTLFKSGESSEIHTAKCLAVLSPCLTVASHGSDFADRKGIYQFLNVTGQSPPEWSTALDQFVICVGALLAASSELDINLNGRDLLQTIFSIETPEKVVSLCRMLLQQSNWKCYDSVIIPHLVKYMNQHWSLSPTLFIAFIVYMIQQGKGSVLKLHVQKSVHGRSITEARIVSGLLAVLNGTEMQVDDDGADGTTCKTLASRGLACLVEPQVVIPALSLHFRTLLHLLQDEDSRTSACPALGYHLESMAMVCKPETCESLVDVWADTLETALPYLHNDATAMLSLAEFGVLMKSYGRKSMFGLSKLSSALTTYIINLNHPNHHLRLASLRYITLFTEPDLDQLTTNNLQGLTKTLQLCLKMEEMENNPNTLREKTMLLRQVETLCLSQHGNPLITEIAVRYCIALLTVAFSPLWQPVSTCLSAAVSANVKVGSQILLSVLEVVHRQVVSASTSDMDSKPKFQIRNDGIEWVIHDPHWSDFKQMSEDNAAIVVDPSSDLDKLLVEATTKSSRSVDPAINYKWLIKTLVPLCGIVEQRSQFVVPLFLELVKHDDGEGVDESTDTDADAVATPVLVESRRQRMSRRTLATFVIEYLSVFAKFRHPEKADMFEQVHQVCLHLLLKDDPKLQRAALDCIAGWKQPGIIRYLSQLRDMTDDSKFRDVMTNWSVLELDSIDPQDRQTACIVLLRILYGKLLARSGKSFSKMKSHRVAILTFIATLSEGDLRFFFGLLSGYFESNNPDGTDEETNSSSNSIRQQFIARSGGFLAVLEDFIRILGSLVIPILPNVMTIILKMAAMSSKSRAMEDDSKQVESRLRTIRQQAIRRLSQIFNFHFDFNFDEFMPSLFSIVLEPRLELFHIELSYGPSALMDLCIAWSQNRNYAPYLVNLSAEIVPQIFKILAAKGVKESAVSSVLSLVENIQRLDEEIEDDSSSSSMIEMVILPHASLFLTNLGMIVERVLDDGQGGLKLTSNNLISRIISSLGRLSSKLNSPVEGRKLVDIVIPFLRKSDKAVPEDRKIDILRVVQSYIPILFADGISSNRPTYEILSRLFYQLYQRTSREQLCRVFEDLARVDASLESTVAILVDLNTWSKRILDEPDFGRKFGALQRITDRTVLRALQPLQWIPILHNMLRCAEDPAEFSVRSAAEHALTNFIEHATARSEDDSSLLRPELEVLVLQIVYPGIRRGVSNPVEFVRHAMTTLLGIVVKQMSHLPIFAELNPLLAGGDDESDFFNNVFHLQLHRRTRALRKLAEYGATGTIRSSTLSEIFIPLLFQYVHNEKERYDPNLAQEAVVCIGSLTKSLKWGPYYGLLRKCLTLVKTKPAGEAIYIRTVVRILDSFHFDLTHHEVSLDVKVAEADAIAAVEDAGVINGSMDVDVDPRVTEDAKADNPDTENADMDVAEGAPIVIDDDVVEDMVLDDPIADTTAGDEEEKQKLMDKIHSTVTRVLLPELGSLLTKQDEKKYTNLRVPIAVGIANLALFLPAISRELQIHRLLVRLSALLRSRVNELRDQTRDAINKILLLIGPSYLPALLTHLKDALLRGYQLHVLGYTVHYILTAIMTTLKPEALNASIAQIVRILIDDIFGSTSEERDAEEFKTKMRETKNTKSFHSFELIASNMGPSAMQDLLSPIKELLLDVSSINIKNKIVEILKRVSGGLTTNTSFSPVNVLGILKSLIEENLRLTEAVGVKKHLGIVDEHAAKDMSQAITRLSENSHVLVEFGLNLLLSGTKRQSIRLTDPTHAPLMNDLVPVLGKCTYSENTEIASLAIRILSLLCQHPPPQFTDMLPIIVKRVFEIVSKMPSTDSEIVQNSLRFLTIIIRDFPTINVSNTQLLALLSLIRVDIENTMRQSTGFALARAILARKVVATEVYDLMDIIATALVTSQSNQTRELARMVYMPYLLDYPHGPKRLQRNIISLVNNLKYEHESGREAVLEMLHGLILKMSNENIIEFGETFFLSLVVMMVNDSSNKCRRMAGELIKALFVRIVALDSDRVVRLLSLWLSDPENEQLLRTAIQAYGLLIEAVKEKSRRWLPDVIPHIQSFLDQAVERIHIEPSQETADTMPWNHAYFPLNTLSKAFEVFPEIGYTQPKVWECVGQLLLHPHLWVRGLSARLLGSMFSQVDPTLVVVKTKSPHPYLRKDGVIRSLTVSLCGQLASASLTPEMGHQAVKNLVFIAKHLEASYGDTMVDEDVLTLDGLCVKMCGLSNGARQRKHYLAVNNTYKWFAAVSAFVSPERLLTLLRPIVTTVYRAINDDAVEHDAADLKILGTEVLEMLQKRVGASAYLQIFNLVHAEIADIRRERKTKRKIEAVTEPVLHAKRKMHKHELKKDARKRKVEQRNANVGRYKRPPKPRTED
ncbi:hypothetical protein SmJEL517_g03788 [Synchytrium microbalum]|uniref:Uncharacterized protein n=1 Tax=Synchytrium microbalum TaxID=1806994 RepID=A0A507BX10_9FUNG|nr:uncharacterized protein SmJEL517_g03788 [Synchytrium microbalum]TPX33347.1 hypothetical protein SmJEL517_g03788 [Synchytrium microbalum]